MPPFNGSGNFSTYTPGNPVIPGTVISATAYNATQQDIAAGLSNAVTRDGQSPLTANLPAAGRKITGLGAGVVAGDSLRFEQLFSQGVEQDIASASTVDIGSLNTTIARITGTTTITSFGTNYNGPRYVRFAGALTLTHSATLVLPGGANITTAAGDAAIVVPIGNPGTGWRVADFTPAAGAFLPDDSVTFAKLQNIATATILGRSTAGTGDVEALTGAQATALLSAASETVSGRVELATDAEAAAGTDASRAVTPASLRGGLNATGSAPIYACRAWVNFNGVGTVAIRASGNVSSITDNGVGDYSVNFTTAMPDANYAAVATPSRVSGDSFFNVAMENGSRTRTTSAFHLLVKVSNGSAEDISNIFAAIFR